MMTTDYEYQVDDDWKQHDHQDHAAGADYHDEVARTQPAKPTITRGDVPDNHHLKLARQQIEEYERRVNADRRFSDILDRQVYEDRAYKKIPLTQNKVALVDAADYEWLTQWKWFAWKSRNIWYARRNISASVRLEQSAVLMHRVIMDASADKQVDHINGDGLDNTRSNLRLCTNQENSRNKNGNRNNTSGYKGVRWHKQRGKWQAYIKAQGRQMHLGLFDSIEAAAYAYDQAARRYFGEYAHFNFPARAADVSFNSAMMHVAYAQAEAATRQAEAIEDLLEFAAELVGSTDLVNALLQWGYRQKAG